MLIFSDIDMNSNDVLQNFGIDVAFGMAFFFGLLIFTEFSTSAVNERDIVLFRRGSKPTALASSGLSDEEALKLEKMDTVEETYKTMEPEKQAARAIGPDVFSWQHISYAVPISGQEERKLLSDISGYVAPGKLTALMGESGAGKTTLLNVLAQRISIGVVSGDKFVNGQVIPRDFQSQTYVPHPTV
jgi:ATP-binding cassette, subfamily G (WHITE), member 2, SNQ2